MNDQGELDKHTWWTSGDGYYCCFCKVAKTELTENEHCSTSNVNHPRHYGGDTLYEVIKVLKAWDLDASFCLGNTVKYIARAGKKDKEKTIEDLKKALWYLKKQIEWLEEESK